jgi:DNA-3-methyladenine glycosylase
MRGRVLPRSFYERPTIEVARGLLGMILASGDRGGRILEVEAYLPHADQAAHSRSGRTRRTEILFGPGGHAYIFLCYGVHYCFNVVAEPEGIPGCVLVRSVEGAGDGPGKLTRALGIGPGDNGCDLTRGRLRVLEGASPAAGEILVTPRVGIRGSASLPLRFLLRR